MAEESLPPGPLPGCGIMEEINDTNRSMSLEEQEARWPTHAVKTSTSQQAFYSGDKRPECGNCGRTGHLYAQCIGPLNQLLKLSGCPIHGTREHSFDECFHPFAHTTNTLLQYLFKNRKGKPMLQSQYYEQIVIDWSLPPNERPLTDEEVASIIGEINKWAQYTYPETTQPGNLWRFLNQSRPVSSNNRRKRKTSRYPSRGRSRTMSRRRSRKRRRSSSSGSSSSGSSYSGSSYSSDQSGSQDRSRSRDSRSRSPKRRRHRSRSPPASRGGGNFDDGSGNAFQPPESTYGNFDDGSGNTFQPPESTYGHFDDHSASGFQQHGPYPNLFGAWAIDRSQRPHSTASHFDDDARDRPQPIDNTSLALNAILQVHNKAADLEMERLRHSSHRPTDTSAPEHLERHQDPSMGYRIKGTSSVPYQNEAARRFQKQLRVIDQATHEYSTLRFLTRQEQPASAPIDAVMTEASESHVMDDASAIAGLHAETQRSINERLVAGASKYANPVRSLVGKLVGNVEFGDYKFEDPVAVQNDLDETYMKAKTDQVPHFLKCIVCRQYAHTECDNPCFLCGSTGHPGKRCRLACPCDYHSDHQKSNCTLECRQCQPDDPDYAPHVAMLCTKYCAICPKTHANLDPDHDAGQGIRCPRKSHTCGAYHLMGYKCPYPCFLEDCEGGKSHDDEHCMQCGSHGDKEHFHNVYVCPHSIAAPSTDDSPRLLWCKWCKSNFPFGPHPCTGVAKDSVTSGPSQSRRMSYKRGGKANMGHRGS